MSYQSIAGAEPDGGVVAALTHHLKSGEVPVAGARSSHFEFQLTKVQNVTLLVTNMRLLVAKDKMIGKPKPVVSIDLTDLVSTGFGPLYGVGPTWQANFHTTRHELAVMFFAGPVQAEAFKDALHAAALASASNAAPVEAAPRDEEGTELRDRLQRLHDLIDDLRPMAGQEFLGRPFGEGCGLEEALQAVFARLESPQDSRHCDEMMALDLLSNTQDEHTVQALLEIMGATAEAVQRHQLSAKARQAVESLGGAAHAFLGQFKGPGDMWQLWNERDDVPAEFLCWHTVARLRMATAGRMPLVERP